MDLNAQLRSGFVISLALMTMGQELQLNIFFWYAFKEITPPSRAHGTQICM